MTFPEDTKFENANQALSLILDLTDQFPLSFLQKANYFGSLLQTSTVSLGSGLEGEVNVPFRDLLPMVHPNDIVFDGMSF